VGQGLQPAKLQMAENKPTVPKATVILNSADDSEVDTKDAIPDTKSNRSLLEVRS